MPYTPPGSSRRASIATTGRPSASVSGHGRHNSEPSLSVLTQTSNNTRPPLSSSYMRRHRRGPSLSRSLGDLQSGSATLYDDRGVNGHASIQAGAVPSNLNSGKGSSNECDSNGANPKTSNMMAELGGAMITVDDQYGKTPDVEEDLSSRLDRAFWTGAPGDDNDIATQTPEHSDQEDGLYLANKPPMVRKKSGELVRPALRLGKKRPSSLPETPTYAKAVHFDPQLDIRHFGEVDIPAALSAGTSPVESYDGDSEFPFGFDEPSARRWEARIANFPRDVRFRESKPVRLDRIAISSDNKYLIGVVAVANLAFHKNVVARFTLDYWKTVSEVTAEYNNDVQLKKETQHGYDTFNFNICLADRLNLEDKRMFICIRYNVDGVEFWDNNNFMNYHVEFRKIQKGDEAKTNGQPRNSSNKLTPDGMKPISPPRSQSIPSLPADLVADTDSASLLSRDFPGVVRDSSSKRPANALGNRYNFGASLTAAMQSGGSNATGRGPSSSEKPGATPRLVNSADEDEPPDLKTAENMSNTDAQTEYLQPKPQKPADLVSDKPDHQSPGYQELVNKYCFYGSPGQGQQTKNEPTRRFFGALDDKVFTTNNPQEYSPSSSNSSSPSPSNSSPTDEKMSEQIVFNKRGTSPNSREIESSRSSSPGVINYSHHQPMETPFLSGSPRPTAIRG